MSAPIGAILPTPKTADAEQLPGSMRIPSKLLDQNDFLKLVVAQMTHQDPMKPTSDTEFIAQMTQFTALEQAKNMQSDIAEMRSQQKMIQAMSLLDREVVVQSNKAGTVETITGVVKGFDLDGQEPKLIIGNERFDLSDILTIRLATAQTAASGVPAGSTGGSVTLTPSATTEAERITGASPGIDPRRNEGGELFP